ncbi:isoaspartyl peptidase/L-asparaginase [Portibacter lacus]|uniref:N(4)-(Beta-N-acetylglucosaminyl)-L-asparaginase n=1 Tax=Portibacter lacus TaxID=1099794 RepID=A0AA37SP59_9BACT|nr:isoaspartyl peptidase/L-asparaginase [Portibacter lacus]GLR16867.1 N(4)-(beta-N-acetylglucosaminyl)-L-asparaginase [Portibacter lacus]
MKKLSRRNFLNTSIALGGGVVLASCAAKPEEEKKNLTVENGEIPIVISTWANKGANKAAWDLLEGGKSSLDAVEAGARIPEGDPKDMSVGYGGRPDREGNVTLDACIMDKDGNCGSVTYLQHIKHPISVARKVMEETPHVMLSGDGALKFALDQGFKKEDLMTDASRKQYKKWLETSEYKPKVNIELHDTIGIIAIDQKGELSGACTTSGLGYKMAGRVGDSPIIGAGLFVDNEVGSAVATGMGELVMRSVGSFLVVELMRQGRTPMEACKEAIMRIVDRQDTTEVQVGYIALSKDGTYGAYSIKPGFVYAVTTKDGTEVVKAESYES